MEIAAAQVGPKAPRDDDGWGVIALVPASANSLRPDVVWKVQGTWEEPDATWPYRNGEGRLLGYACRWDIPAKCDGKKPDKLISFATWCRNRNGARRWKLKHLPTPRSLYALDKLARRPDAPVLIVEGEKAADAAALIFPESVCVTSSGGSQAASKADWTPLAGRLVTIWPDHDEPGLKYAGDVAGLVAPVAASVRIVPVPEHFPAKWDLADQVPDGADLAAVLKAAKPWIPAGFDSFDSDLGKGFSENTWPEPKPIPDGLLPVAAFDPAFLPDAIAPWVMDISDRMQCPPDFVGVPAMVALGSVIGRKVAIRPQHKTDWFEVANLWGCIVGRPGALKSPAMLEALKPLQRLEAEARKANAAAAKEYGLQVEFNKLRREDAAKKARKGLASGLATPGDLA